MALNMGPKPLQPLHPKGSVVELYEFDPSRQWRRVYADGEAAGGWMLLEHEESLGCRRMKGQVMRDSPGIQSGIGVLKVMSRGLSRVQEAVLWCWGLEIRLW